MASKLLVVLLAALCVSQVSSARSARLLTEKDLLQDILDGAVEFAEKAVDALLQVGVQVLANLQASVGSEVARLSSELQASEDSSSALLVDISENVTAVVEVVEGQAAAQNTSVSDCLSPLVAQGEDLEHQAVASLDGCLDAGKTLESQLNAAVSLAKVQVDWFIQQAGAELKACLPAPDNVHLTTIFEAAECLSGKVELLNTQGTVLFDTLKLQGVTAVDLVNDAIGGAQQCLSTQVATALSDLDNLVAEALACLSA